MENYPIMISKDKQVHHFEVGEYLHDDGERCKYRIYEHGVYVASFTPNEQDILHICQNPGAIGEDLLHLLADKIEAHHPHATSHNIRKLKS